MFIRSSRGHGAQQSARGPFIMVFGNEKAPKRIIEGVEYVDLRVLVRHARLSQTGQFMMGHVDVVIPEPREVLGITLSGTYGSDGLPIEVTLMREYDLVEGEAKPRDASAKAARLWEKLHPLPDELVVQFWKGGGHNSAGAEGPALHAWAKGREKELRHLRKEKAA